MALYFAAVSDGCAGDVGSGAIHFPLNGIRKRGYDEQPEALIQDRLLMKKLKHESELVKEAIRAGVKYGEERGVVEFEPTDSANDKIEYIYRLLVHDKLIQPLPEEQVSQKAMRHRLAIWVSKQLPKDHPLLK